MKKKMEKKTSFDEDIEYAINIFKNIDSTMNEIKSFMYPALNKAKICNKRAINAIIFAGKLQKILKKISFNDNSIDAKDLELV